MTGGREYTEDEFGVIVRYPEFSDEDLARRPGRAAGSAGGVHHLMHFYHLGLNFAGLSQMILSRLQKGGWTCPVCGEAFPAGPDPRGSR